MRLGTLDLDQPDYLPLNNAYAFSVARSAPAGPIQKRTQSAPLESVMVAAPSNSGNSAGNSPCFRGFRIGVCLFRTSRIHDQVVAIIPRISRSHQLFGYQQKAKSAPKGSLQTSVVSL
jgi:hypothetical protein